MWEGPQGTPTKEDDETFGLPSGQVLLVPHPLRGFLCTSCPTPAPLHHSWKALSSISCPSAQWILGPISVPLWPLSPAQALP